MILIILFINCLAFDGFRNGFYDDDDMNMSIILRRSGGVQRSLHESQLSENNNRIQRGRVEKRKKLTKQQKNIEEEIKMQKRSTQMLLKTTPFTRIVKEMISEIAGEDRRVQSEAINALMEASQQFLINLFEASYSNTAFAKRKTLQVKDMQHVRKILSYFGHDF